MRKVSLWRRLGTRVQVLIVCVLVFTLTAFIAAILLPGNTNSTSSVDLPFALIPPTPAPPTPAPELTHPDWEEILAERKADNRPLSLLTGVHAEQEYINRRPLAIVINNSFAALPQSGVAEADIIYEVLAEGNTTRLVAIFQSSIPDKIGPIRSARDYFVDFALNHDAFFVHHGGSPTGYERIRRLLGNSNAIDGMRYEGTVFWRDRSWPYWSGNSGRRSVEHSSYTGWQELSEHFEQTGVRGYFNGNANERPWYGFSFGDIPVGQDYIHSDILQVVIPFANTVYTAFDLNSQTGLYGVSHARGAWIDELSRMQVSVANILVQHTVITVADNEGRRNVTTVGSGTGYLVRGGHVFNVTWQKSSHTSPMQWFFRDGTPIVLAPGRTWINVLQTTAEPEFNSGIGEQYGI